MSDEKPTTWHLATPYKLACTMTCAVRWIQTRDPSILHSPIDQYHAFERWEAQADHPIDWAVQSEPVRRDSLGDPAPWGLHETVEACAIDRCRAFEEKGEPIVLPQTGWREYCNKIEAEKLLMGVIERREVSALTYRNHHGVWRRANPTLVFSDRSNWGSALLCGEGLLQEFPIWGCWRRSVDNTADWVSSEDAVCRLLTDRDDWLAKEEAIRQLILQAATGKILVRGDDAAYLVAMAAAGSRRVFDKWGLDGLEWSLEDSPKPETKNSENQTEKRGRPPHQLTDIILVELGAYLAHHRAEKNKEPTNKDLAGYISERFEAHKEAPQSESKRNKQAAMALEIFRDWKSNAK